MNKTRKTFFLSIKGENFSETLTPYDFYNAFTLDIPKKRNVFQKLFPNHMIWILIICILIKLCFFAYGVYMFNNNLNRTTGSIFTSMTKVWWNLEGLCDYGTNGDYVLFRNNWLTGEPLYSEAFNGRYLYPPTFYYIINIFSNWTVFSAAIVMFICNCLTGYFLFHLAKKFGANGRSAKIIMALSLLAPINLYYSDFIWQNSGIVTTFIVLSMLMISKEKFGWGMFWIGFATTIKQIAMLYIPIFVLGIVYKSKQKEIRDYKHKWTFIEYFKSISWADLFYYSSIPILVFICFSYPFIFTNSNEYLQLIFGSLSGMPNTENIAIIFKDIVPVTTNFTFLGYFPDLSKIQDILVYKPNKRAMIDVAFAWLGFKVKLSTELTTLFSLLFHFRLFFYLFIILIVLYYWMVVKNKRYTTDKEYYWYMWFAASLCSFASILFGTVGIYKYYFISLAPTWAIFGFIFPLNHEKWKHANKNDLSTMIKKPKYIKSQIIGGGTIFHIFEIILIQLLIMYSNKWLAPALIYLPIFIFNFVQLKKSSKPSQSEKIINEMNKISNLPDEKKSDLKLKLELDEKSITNSDLRKIINSHIDFLKK